MQLEVAEACWEGVQVQGSLLVRAASPLGHLELEDQSPSGPLLLSEQAANNAVAAGLSSFVPGVANNHHLRGLWRGAGSSASLAEEPVDPAYSQPCSGVSHLDAELLHCALPEGLPRLVYSPRAGRVRLHNVRVANRGVDWASKHNVYWRHKVARHEACRILLRGRSEFEARDVTLAGDLTFEVPDGYRMTVSVVPDGRWKAELTPLAEDTPPAGSGGTGCSRARPSS